MKIIISLLLLTFYTLSAFANSYVTDSLKKRVAMADSDTARVLLYADLSDAFVFSSPDSSLFYAQKGLLLSQASTRVSKTRGKTVRRRCFKLLIVTSLQVYVGS